MSMLRPVGSVVLCAIALAVIHPARSGESAAAAWPQFQCNAARTGWTPDSPAPPFELAYALDFTPEPLSLVQPVVSGGQLYVPTLHGRVYAFGASNGERRWVAEGMGPVPRSAAASGGFVFVADAYGTVHARRSGDGSPAWKQDLGFGISASPCLDNGRLYIGTRRGEFHCLDAKTGSTLWKTALDHYVWSSAAVAEGKVYVGTDGELRLYCLDADTGAILWKSGRLSGLFMRDWCPVAAPSTSSGQAGGRVFVRTLPAEYILDAVPAPYALWWAGKTREEFLGYYDAVKRGELPEAFARANAELVADYAANPWKQTMFAFDAATGEAPYVAGAFHLLAGWLLACPPPAVDSEGMLQVTVPYFGSRFARMDAATGRITQFVVGPLFKKEYAPGDERPEDVTDQWLRRYAEGGTETAKADGYGGNSDEAHAASCGGDRIYWAHFHGPAGGRGFNQGMVFDVKTRRVDMLRPAPDRPKGPTLKVSVEAGQPVPYPALSDNTQSEAFAPPALWGDLVLHHHDRGRITVLRGTGDEGEQQP